MIRFIFMLGRPGCGKSYLYKNVFIPVIKEKVKEVERMDDFPVLKKLLDEDKDFKRHIRKDGGFEVTDWSIVDDVLREMDLILKKKERDSKIIFVEFARDNYRRAVSNFSEYIEKRSILLYIWAPFEVCLKSNIRRFKEGGDPDDHIVPVDLMNTYYRTDDLEEVFLKNKNNLPEKFNNWNIIFFDNSNRTLLPVKQQKIFKDLIRRYL